MITTLKGCFVTLLAVGVTGWQSRLLAEQSATPANALGVAGFPIGTYTSCAQGKHNPSGNEFLNSAGFQDGARLTLAQTGTTVTSKYVDQNGLTQSLVFSTATDAVATIVQKGQAIPGFTSFCVLGPGKRSSYPASMAVAAGALTYDAGIVFLTLTGQLRSDAGTCGTLSQSQASFWLACTNRQDGSVRSVNVGPASVAQLPAGRYSCRTQVETLYHINGRNQYGAGGATGMLTLTEDGPKVVAQYSGDTSLSGTLRFTATTSTTGRAEAGQTLTASCMIGMGRSLPSATPERVRIAAGSLTFIGSTLFMSFAGTMEDSSSCAGAQAAGSVICSK